MRHRLAEQLAGKQSPAQLGRALNELGIEQIPANSSQAKGHIERIWRTCQDRLVSEFASSTPPPWRKPTPYWPSSAATTTRVDRKSTRLNSNHLVISYAVFCLQKKQGTKNPGKSLRHDTRYTPHFSTVHIG